MAGGEVNYKLFSKVVTPTALVTPTDVPNFSQAECCFALPALAATTGTDIYKNDIHNLIKKYDKDFMSFVTIFIQKREGGNWVDKVEVVNDDYGTFYQLGGFNDSTLRLNYVRLDVEWQKVLNAFDEGTYRFRFREIDFQENEEFVLYPFEFCLQTYTEERADFTTRFDWTLENYIGNWEDDRDVWDFTQMNNGFPNQIRLPESIFGYNKSSYEREYIRYQNGQQVWLQDEQVESYTWNSGQYPALLHDFIKTNILQADEVTVTDYNSNNPNVIKDKAIKPNSNYEPDWKYNNKRAFVSVDFVQEYQNKRNRRC